MNKRYRKMVVVVLFLFAFYMVQFGPFSSAAVEARNGGFGTFDMKPYTPELMNSVLSGMDEAGFAAEYHYYICDTIFIIMFFAFQYILISDRVKSWKIPYFVLISAAGLRGVSDIIENTLLTIGISSYPNINTEMISFCSKITQFKLGMIGLWVVTFVVSGVCALGYEVARRKENEKAGKAEK